MNKDTKNHEKAPRQRESEFDRKLIEWRRTGDFQKPSATRKTGEVQVKQSTERSQALDEIATDLESLAFLDPLTERYNQRTILRNLQEEVRRARRYKRALGILLVEIDNFEELCGQAVGSAVDFVLKNVGTVIAQQVREVDTIGRYDGGKFLVLCPETTLSQVSILAERLRIQLQSARLAHFGTPFTITVSAGLASYPQTASTPEELLSAAAEALELAVKCGGNVVAGANPVDGFKQDFEVTEQTSRLDDPSGKDQRRESSTQDSSTAESSG